jgi:hypothetical protein
MKFKLSILGFILIVLLSASCQKPRSEEFIHINVKDSMKLTVRVNGKEVFDYILTRAQAYHADTIKSLGKWSSPFEVEAVTVEGGFRTASTTRGKLPIKQLVITIRPGVMPVNPSNVKETTSTPRPVEISIVAS